MLSYFYCFFKMDLLESNFETTCNFCNKVIQMYPVECINSDYKFCDLCCAKLFHDNKEKIIINSQAYIRHYRNLELSPLAVKIYERVGNNLFEMLPLYKMPPECKSQEAKLKYFNIFMH